MANFIITGANQGMGASIIAASLIILAVLV